LLDPSWGRAEARGGPKGAFLACKSDETSENSLTTRWGVADNEGLISQSTVLDRSVALKIAMKKPCSPLLTAFVAFLAVGFWLTEVTRSQEAALKDTASLASRQFAEKLYKSVQRFAKKSGVAIKNISIDVEGSPLTADLQRGLIEVPLIRYLQEQNFYSKTSSELARIKYRFDPSDAPKPAELRIELIQLINKNTNESRNIDECKELQTIIDVSGSQLSTNSFGDSTDSPESPFARKNGMALVSRLTQKPTNTSSAVIQDGFFYTKDPRNEKVDNKFGFRLVSDAASNPIIHRVNDGIPVCTIDPNTEFFVEMKNNTESRFAFDAFIDGYAYLVPTNRGKIQIPNYLMFESNETYKVGWVLVDPTKEKTFENRSMTLKEIYTSNGAAREPEINPKMVDRSLAGSVTIRIYKIKEREQPKGNDVQIKIGKITGDEIKPLSGELFEAVGYPLEPISQIVIKYEKGPGK